MAGSQREDVSARCYTVICLSIGHETDTVLQYVWQGHRTMLNLERNYADGGPGKSFSEGVSAAPCHGDGMRVTLWGPPGLQYMLYNSIAGGTVSLVASIVCRWLSPSEAWSDGPARSAARSAGA